MFFSFLAVFAVALIFWLSRSYARYTIPVPASGGVYIEGLIGQPVSLNPIIPVNDVDRDLIELLFANLLDLTEKYEVSDDQKTWSFTLKEKLVWSDNAPLTADDVLFTLETIKDPEARSPLFNTWQGVIAERLSERQFRFSLKTPYAFFLDNLKTFKIAPNHIFSKIPPANLRLSNYNLEPIGSGPFIFENFDKRKDGFIVQYKLVSNEYFSGVKPRLKEFRFWFFTNKEDLLAAFKHQKIDGFGGLEAADFKKLQIGYRAFKLITPSYYAVFLNSTLAAPLKDKDFRQALAMATDKDRILKEVFDFQGLVIRGPIVPIIEGYGPNIYKDDIFDSDRASAILENKGWRREEDGIRAKIIDRKKTRLEFEIVIPQVEFLLKTAEILKADWEKIGVRLNPVVLRPAEIANDIIKTRNYQMLIFGTIFKNNPDIFSFWHSSERFYPGGNLSLYANKLLDSLLESVKLAINSADRSLAVTKIQDLIHHEQPAIFLFSPYYLYVTRPELGGFNAQFIAGRPNRFDNVSEWHVNYSRAIR